MRKAEINDEWLVFKKERNPHKEAKGCTDTLKEDKTS